MDPTISLGMTLLAGCGVIGGLGLLARGLLTHRSSILVGDTSTSTISSIAAGEVRISGIIEPAELTLVSLLQSVACVYYRATVGRSDDTSAIDTGFVEERSIGFRVRDATGSIRIFPRGARFDAPIRFSEDGGVLRASISGLSIRTGPATRTGELDREAAIAELLQVRDPRAEDASSGLGYDQNRRSYREARLEIGDAVTVVGRAIPYSDLNDPVASDYGSEIDLLESDPEVAADLAEARASGTLAGDPATAWGNAAIPGFGIGRPASTPEIDPDASRLPLATDAQAARAAQTFMIDPEALVLVSSAEAPLLIAYGTPGVVMARSESSYAMGLFGAVLAITSAMALAFMINEGFIDGTSLFGGIGL